MLGTREDISTKFTLFLSSFYAHSARLPHMRNDKLPQSIEKILK